MEIYLAKKNAQCNLFCDQRVFLSVFEINQVFLPKSPKKKFNKSKTAFICDFVAFILH